MDLFFLPIRLSILIFLPLLLFFHIGKAQQITLHHSIEAHFLHHVFAEDNFYYETDSKGHFHGVNLVNNQTFSDSLDGTRVPDYLEQLDKVKNKAIFHNEHIGEYYSTFTFDSTGFTEMFEGNVNYKIFNADGYAIMLTDQNTYLTDGTINGTVNLIPGKGGSQYTDGIYSPVTNSIYFESGKNVVKTDGTIEGTEIIWEIPDDYIYPLRTVFATSENGDVYYTYKTKTASGYPYCKIYKFSGADNSVEFYAEFDEEDPVDYFEEGKTTFVGNTFMIFTPGILYALVNGEISWEWGATLLESRFVGFYKGKALFFDVDYGQNGYLLQTDGTFNGTKVITDGIYPYTKILTHNDILYFSRTKEEYGTELWQYDGTNISLVDEVVPGEKGIKIDDIHAFNNALYFSGTPEDTDLYNIYKLTDKSKSFTIGAYADYNTNGIKDEEEPWLPNQHFVEETKNLQFHTSQDLNLISLEDGSYSFSLMPPEGWAIPSDFEPKEINLPADHEKTFSFPLEVDSTYIEVQARIAPTPTRCSFETDFNLHYQNNGLTIAQGEIRLKPDPQFEFISAFPQPSVTDDGELNWELEELGPRQTGKISITFKMPDFESSGDLLSTSIITDFKDPSGNFHHQDTSHFSQVLTCSYDPNDIQVNPSGIGDKHLTLKNQELEYLIRFQNTGTDTAFNIVVRDTLSTFLAPETIEIVGSSHQMYSTVEGKIISFHFNDILLPDSIRNEPESHGYVLYTIKPKKDLPDSAVIRNKADIYFDFNPPITTNTVFNTLVEKLPPPPEKNKLQGISLMAYNDLNNNGKKESGENNLPDQQYVISPGSTLLFTAQDSSFIKLEEGSYNVTLIPSTGWKSSSGRKDISFILSKGERKAFSFGLTADNTFTKVKAQFASGPIECEEQAFYAIHYKNKGTTVAGGTIKAIPDPQIQFVSADPAASNHFADTLAWNIPELHPGQTGTIQINLKMPGNQRAGDTLSFFLVSSFADLVSSSSTNTDTTKFQQILDCPNMQNRLQVNPFGIGEKNVSLKNQDFNYLINFHSIEKKPIEHIQIENMVGEQADPQSINLIGSSHPFYATFNSDELRFHFLSNKKSEKANESQGYILYSIKPKRDLARKNILHNQAIITFNSDDPVSTNPVMNTLVEKLPSDKAEVTHLKDTEDNKEGFKTYPNPAKDHLFIEWNKKENKSRNYQLINCLGQKVVSLRSSEPFVKLNISSFAKGLYIIQIQGKEKKVVQRVFIK